MLKDPCNILQSRPGPPRTPAQPRAVLTGLGEPSCLAAVGCGFTISVPSRLCDTAWHRGGSTIQHLRLGFGQGKLDQEDSSSSLLCEIKIDKEHLRSFNLDHTQRGSKVLWAAKMGGITQTCLMYGDQLAWCRGIYQIREPDLGTAQVFESQQLGYLRIVLGCVGDTTTWS